MIWLIAVAAAQIADIVTFAATTAIYPIAGEQNGLARILWADGGIFGVEAFKLGGLILTLGIVSLLRRAPDWVRVAAVSVPVALGLAGAAANLASLLGYLAGR